MLGSRFQNVTSTVKPVLMDHCHDRPYVLKGPHIPWQKVTHVSATEYATKDRLPRETVFLWPMSWSFKTSSTVSTIVICT